MSLPNCLPDGRRHARLAFFFILSAAAYAQTGPDLSGILARVERLERENRALAEELRALRNELTAARASSDVEERLEIQESRNAEMAQTKVEASQRFPVRLTGMALVNAFANSRGSTSDNPIVASPASGPAFSGATVRQTVLGLRFHGPQTIWNGRVRGSAFFDFSAGTGTPNNQILRLRTASMEVDWKSRGVMVGQEKPIFAPRDPNSLAQVQISPLTGAGNLWLWQPQVRFEQRFSLAERTSLSAQIGVVQTSEAVASVPPAFAGSLARARPGLQGRFNLTHAWGDERRIEFAPGFHTSATHIAGISLPSNLFSLDWLAKPWRPIEFSGAFFKGKNLAHFGIGGTRQGFTFLADDTVIPIHSTGGWGQFTVLATSRLTFNIFGGQHDNRNRDLLGAAVGRNLAYAINMQYRLAPNVILGVESMQVRTNYLGLGNRLNNHYDLAVAYLF